MSKIPLPVYIVLLGVCFLLLILFFLAGFTNLFQGSYPSQVQRIEKSTRVEPGGITVTPELQQKPNVSPNPMFPNGYNIP